MKWKAAAFRFYFPNLPLSIGWYNPTGDTEGIMEKFNPLNPPPDGADPQNVRFNELRVEPWPDGDKIRVHAQIAPFLKPPDLEAAILNSTGDEISSVTIIENIDFNLVFTMHIRRPSVDGRYTLIGRILYEDLGVVDEATTEFVIPPTG